MQVGEEEEEEASEIDAAVTKLRWGKGERFGYPSLTRCEVA